jgi:hypothetical protein
MSEARELWRRLRMLFHRRQFQAELEEEMRLHLELRAQEHAENGLGAEVLGARLIGDSAIQL